MTKRSAARASQLIDNDQVRVTRFEFEPGDETGWHEHGFDYVITALTDCTMLIEESDGERTVETESGAAYHRRAGVKHNVINGGSASMAFIEIEMKL
jgi:quercetin dioxygenase-like cupin family protein